MPELPEVEAALDLLRSAAEGQTIARVRLLHPAFRRRVSLSRLRLLVGAHVERVERRGKHQLLHLRDGRVLHAHFRMSGDWVQDTTRAALPRFARVAIEFINGSRLVLVDSRALGTFELHPAGEMPELGLGPDAADANWSAEQLSAALALRRAPIKNVLLDQRLVAGLGNIYVAESLWRARIDPRAASNSLSRAQVRALRTAISTVLKRATGARYTDDAAAQLDVYDRAGQPCRRCKTSIERMVQAGRGTYYCPSCQK